MSRSLIAYLVLVLLPAAALAVIAYRVADWDHAERLRGHRARIEGEADLLARRVEGAIDGAARELDEVLSRAGEPASDDDGALDSYPVGFARGGRWIGYLLEPAPEEEAAAVPDLERKFYELSLHGGESYELERGDPARALDAYAFYLPRLRSPELRDRLRFRIARAAIAGGRGDLAAAILRRLLEERGGARTEEGLPVELLAGARLIEIEGADGSQVGEILRARLRELRRSLATERLEGWARTVASGDAELRRYLERRRALEAAVSRHPGILAAQEAVLDGGTLLRARSLGARAGGPAARAIAGAPVEVPPLAAGELEAHLLSAVEFAAAEAASAENPASVVRPVRLAGSGPALAAVLARDPDFAAKLADSERRRVLQRALVGLLVLLSAGGAAAMVLYLARERRLARLRAQLLANVSHELKTPVTSIRMFSEMLAEDPVTLAQSRRFGQLLRSESLRLSRIIENILDVTRFRRREEYLSLESIDLGAILRYVAEGFSFRAREQGVEFHTEGVPAEGEERPELRLETSPAAVERILFNLLDNALKYRCKDNPQVRLVLKVESNRAAIAVVDNGIGIPGRDQERIFEEFFRVRYDDYGVQGSGLGLAIARRLAGKIGGEIRLESREGRGSTFTLILPAGAGSAKAGAADVPAAPGGSEGEAAA